MQTKFRVSELMPKLTKERNRGADWLQLAKKYKFKSADLIEKYYFDNISTPLINILLVDIETAPVIAQIWSLRDLNVGLNQIQKDWHLLSFAAKWIDSDEIFYFDQRNKKDMSDDKNLMLKLWKLLNKADIVVGHNIKKFDFKKYNARFLINDIDPPNKYRLVDTLTIARKHFAMTSNKLEYLARVLKVKHQKLKHEKFSGHELWTECLKNNLDAWREMEKYNRQDVFALQEVYLKLRKWSNDINYSIYSMDNKPICECGSTRFRNAGFHYNKIGKVQRVQCVDCKKRYVAPENLISKKSRDKILRPE
jgi:DNA polymerase III epsilon subunit-like protein